MGSEDSDYEYEYVLLELPELEETNFLRQTCKRLDIVVRTRAACPRQRPPPPALLSLLRRSLAPPHRSSSRRACAGTTGD